MAKGKAKKPAKAKAAFEAALAIQEKALGADHPAVADTLSAIGIAANGLGVFRALAKGGRTAAELASRHAATAQAR